MELRNTPGRPTPERSGTERRLDLARGNETTDILSDARGQALRGIAKVEEARAHAAEQVAALSRAAHGDTVELSAAAQLFSAESTAGSDARAGLVAELRHAYEAGSLNTPERIERAAERLLAGE